nr:ORF6N domain-containing protein [Dysgonomonas mossii]
MLDFDLAERYQVSTKALKQAVKRNLQRFPEDFMFEMNSEEWEILRSQIVTSSWGGTRYMPFVFTEQGVAMLSSVLRSEIAIEVNISIMRAFVKMRELSSRYSELNQKLETFMIDTNIQFNEVYQALTELASKKESEDKPRKKVGFVKDE